jgi:hypothetical protein
VATELRRRTAFDPVTTFREHMVLKAEGSRITKRATALKDRLKKWLPEAPEGYENEKGSVFVDLEETLEVDGKAYRGMELRKSVSTKFDEEEAARILNLKTAKDKTILADAQSSYIDQDKVYRLLAEGRITEKDLDKMFKESESYAFWPVEGEVL